MYSQHHKPCCLVPVMTSLASAHVRMHAHCRRGLLFAILQGLYGPEHVALQGAQAHAAGVLFPSDDEVLQRTILIANINPLINTEQVRSHLPIYATCGILYCIC